MSHDVTRKLHPPYRDVTVRGGARRATEPRGGGGASAGTRPDCLAVAVFSQVLATRLAGRVTTRALPTRTHQE